MQQPPSTPRRTEQRDDAHPEADESRGDRPPNDSDHPTLKEAVETAASAYFTACRKIARAINRLKQH